MEGDCNVYAHSSLWMRPTGEWSINAKMVYTAIQSRRLFLFYAYGNAGHYQSTMTPNRDVLTPTRDVMSAKCFFS